MKRLLFTLLCILILPAMFAQKTSETFERGFALFQSGKYEKALPFFEEDLAQQPKAGYSYFGAGSCLIELERYSEAIPYLDKALKYLPKSERIYVYPKKAAACYNAEGPSSSLAVMDEAIKKYPKVADLYTMRGCIYEDMEYYPSAQRDFETAVALDPTQWEAAFHLSQVLQNNQKTYEAVEWAKRAISINRQNSYMPLYLSALYVVLEQYNEAINAFSTHVQFEEFYPEFSDVLTALADTVPEQLIAKMDAQSAKYPTKAIWPWISSQVCGYHSEYHRALPYAEKAFTLSGDSSFLDNLIRIEINAGECDLALKDIERLLEWNLPYEQYLDLKLNVLTFNARYDEALQLYNATVMPFTSDTLTLLQQIGDSIIRHTIIDTSLQIINIPSHCYAGKGEWKKAIESAEKSWPARVTTGDSIHVYNLLMDYYTYLGDTASARDAARKAIATEPDRIIAYYLLGDMETAQKNMKEKYDMDSENSAELYSIAQVYASMNDIPNALLYLRKAFEKGYYYGVGRRIATDCELSILRDLPEFKALMEEYAEKQKR